MSEHDFRLQAAETDISKLQETVGKHGEDLAKQDTKLDNVIAGQNELKERFTAANRWLMTTAGGVVVMMLGILYEIGAGIRRVH